jgi:hypothetical protein
MTIASRAGVIASWKVTEAKPESLFELLDRSFVEAQGFEIERLRDRPPDSKLQRGFYRVFTELLILGGAFSILSTRAMKPTKAALIMVSTLSPCRPASSASSW